MLHNVQCYKIKFRKNMMGNHYLYIYILSCFDTSSLLNNHPLYNISLAVKPYVKESECRKVHEAAEGDQSVVACLFHSKPAPEMAYWKNNADGKRQEKESLIQVRDFYPDKQCSGLRMKRY